MPAADRDAPDDAPGVWPSPLTAAAAGGRVLEAVAFAGSEVWWSESRPEEDGRFVVCRAGPDGAVQDLSPAGTSVRSRVHEYGGRAWVPIPEPWAA